MTFTPPISSLDALDSALATSSLEHHHEIESPGATVITFVVSHLAAFDDMVDKRNADFHDLTKRLTFDSSVLAASSAPEANVNGGTKASISVLPAQDNEGNPKMPKGMALSQSLVTVPEKFGVFESDILFWMVSECAPIM